MDAEQINAEFTEAELLTLGCTTGEICPRCGREMIVPKSSDLITSSGMDSYCPFCDE